MTDLLNHNIEHGTKELCAGMPSLCLRTSGGEWSSFGFSARSAEEVPDWTYRVNKQRISKEPTQSPPGSGYTMDDWLWFPPLVRRDGTDSSHNALTPRRTGPLELWPWLMPPRRSRLDGKRKRSRLASSPLQGKNTNYKLQHTCTYSSLCSREFVINYLSLFPSITCSTLVIASPNCSLFT